MAATRSHDAARQLGQLLTVDVIGELLDTVGDADLRDLILKAAIRARLLAVEDIEAHTTQPNGGEP